MSNEAIIKSLTSKDEKYACTLAEKIISESMETNQWYKYIDNFAELLDYSKSLVRNRALYIIATNAQWDENDKFDDIMPKFLSHITDDKHIIARQCIKALVQVGQAKTKYVPIILEMLEKADLSKYKDSMRLLIEKDIEKTVKILKLEF